jgi:hypothetical protein
MHAQLHLNFMHIDEFFTTKLTCKQKTEATYVDIYFFLMALEISIISQELIPMCKQSNHSLGSLCYTKNIYFATKRKMKEYSAKTNDSK